MKNSELKSFVVLSVMAFCVCGIISEFTSIFIPEVKAQKPIKVEPPVEVKKKFVDIALSAPTCPRVNIPAKYRDDLVEPYSDADENEFEHCQSCGMGVFFKDKEEKVSCSYCEKIKSLL